MVAMMSPNQTFTNAESKAAEMCRDAELNLLDCVRCRQKHKNVSLVDKKMSFGGCLNPQHAMMSTVTDSQLNFDTVTKWKNTNCHSSSFQFLYFACLPATNLSCHLRCCSSLTLQLLSSALPTFPQSPPWPHTCPSYRLANFSQFPAWLSVVLFSEPLHCWLTENSMLWLVACSVEKKTA